MQRIAIFGGTFDPVHEGHIQTSIKIQHAFHFDDYYFLPCKNPLLKSSPTATPNQRIDMLRLALAEYPFFKIDLREMMRDTPSYMIDTLSSFRMEYAKACITLIIGYDAFLSLPQWHQSNKILKLANVLVINRNSSQQVTTEELQKLMNSHQSEEKEVLLNNKFGIIYCFNAGNYDISSTRIREQIKNKQTTGDALNTRVLEYIKSSRLYL